MRTASSTQPVITQMRPGLSRHGAACVSALISTNSMELRTVQTGLRAMMTLDVGVEWQQLMAMSTLITVPTSILYVALQKYFVQGITKVGIK